MFGYSSRSNFRDVDRSWSRTTLDHVSTHDIVATSRKLHAMCCWSDGWTFLRCAFVWRKPWGLPCCTILYETSVARWQICHAKFLNFFSRLLGTCSTRLHGVFATRQNRREFSFLLQSLWVSTSRPLANPGAFPRAQVSYARMRRFWTRHGKLLIAQKFVRLSTGQQAEE